DTALNGNADRAGNNKGGWNRDDNRQRDIVGKHIVLQHEGGIGTKHHHFAMCHVDHAHDAKGDGEADGGQYQHRAEAQAKEGGFESGVKRAFAINALERRGGDFHYLTVRLVIDQAGQAVVDIVAQLAIKALHRRKANVGIDIVKVVQCQRDLHLFDNVVVLFAGKLLAQQVGGICINVLAQLLDRAQTHAGVRIIKVEAGESTAQLAAQAVIGGDAFCVGGLHVDRRAGSSIDIG